MGRNSGPIDYDLSKFRGRAGTLNHKKVNKGDLIKTKINDTEQSDMELDTAQKKFYQTEKKDIGMPFYESRVQISEENKSEDDAKDIQKKLRK